MIYPYSRSYEPYVLYSGLLKLGEIRSLISPKGWGLCGDSVIYENKELVVTDDFSAQLGACTAVWFVDDEHNGLPKNLIVKKLQEAVKKGKNIIFTRYKNSVEYQEMVNMIPLEQNITPCNMELQLDYSDDYCYKIETPVITVFGTAEQTDKFLVQLALRDKFLQMGYNVSSVSSRLESKLYGVHPIPHFMFDKTFDECKKVIGYNHYVKKIELQENPDILIIGIPGGILPYDQINHNNYGITAYEISFAVPCDGGIMCMPYNPIFTGEFSRMEDDIRKRFSFSVISYHIAPMVIDAQNYVENKKHHFVSLKKGFIKEKIKSYGISNLFDMSNTDDVSCAIQLILDTL